MIGMQQKLCASPNVRADLGFLTGNWMTNRGVTISGSPRPVKRASTRGTPFKGGGRHSAAAAVPVATFALIAVSAATAGYLAWPKPATDENTASVSEAHRLGVIVSDTGNLRCVHATFDNLTGRITEKSVSCEPTASDGHRPAAPLGTVHTLNAISNSFR
jgi:hypothetical protein